MTHLISGLLCSLAEGYSASHPISIWECWISQSLFQNIEPPSSGDTRSPHLRPNIQSGQGEGGQSLDFWPQGCLVLASAFVASGLSLCHQVYSESPFILCKNIWVGSNEKAKCPFEGLQMKSFCLPIASTILYLWLRR